MAETFVELGATTVDHLTEQYWDRAYDKVSGRKRQTSPGAQAEGDPRNIVSSRNPGRHRNTLPSPERERDRDTVYISERRKQKRDDSLERESQASERVIGAYENERDDPIRPVDPRLERARRDSARPMSQANGYAPSARPRSANPPRTKYYDDDSDHDERDGRRYRSSGRGYDDYDDQPYDREIIETERYRGVSNALVPARPEGARRLDSSNSRAYENNAPYAAGAVAPYRRSQQDLGTETCRRSRSRGRRDRYDRDYDDRDRSYSRSRSASRERGPEGWRGKLDNTFDTSMQGLGVGIAGAVVGGLAGREFGNKHKNRDVLIGAVIGGLGANLAENKWKDWKDKKEGRLEEKEDRWEQKWDGRSRSNVR
ncbi:hypothetical protein EJ03DRAFT_351783 [Teratosphaeria nubilosa]|uniref:Glycine zipper 2TM domain-containing protein n=1 Tax=Teratosphaeria nubilosa TaxID=161662 RepID=A0A6G1L7X8_9PEZI|nr:hypothetical protein EJ03DRAFT_351783 [Teratosphaeria nubilosa]